MIEPSIDEISNQKVFSGQVDSWKRFFTFQAFLICGTTPGIYLIVREMPRVGGDPGFVRASLVAILGSLCGLGLSVVHRAVTRRNLGMAFWHIPALSISAIGYVSPQEPLSSLSLSRILIFLVYVPFVLVVDFSMIWLNRWKAKRRRKSNHRHPSKNL